MTPEEYLGPDPIKAFERVDRPEQCDRDCGARCACCGETVTPYRIPDSNFWAYDVCEFSFDDGDGNGMYRLDDVFDCCADTIEIAGRQRVKVYGVDMALQALETVSTLTDAGKTYKQQAEMWLKSLRTDMLLHG